MWLDGIGALALTDLQRIAVETGALSRARSKNRKKEMKRKTVILTLALLTEIGAASAATLNVPVDFPTIQAAINAANEGDTISVSPGTYFEAIQVNAKNVRIVSVGGPSVTTIDASFASATVRLINVNRQTLLDGFTIQGGQSTSGGGVVINGSPTISNNIIQGNRSTSGNGMSVSFSAPLIRDNIIRNNTSMSGSSGGGGGGGIYVGGAGCQGATCTEIIANLIENNSVPSFTWGGGILLFASGPVRIVGNTIRNNSAPTEGGGIAAFNSADALIENNIIEGNRTTSPTGSGGGISWLVPSGERGPWLIGNTIVGNQASLGSAVLADGFDSASRVINNLIVNTSTTQSVVHCGEFNDPFPPVIRNNMIHANGSSEFGGLCAGALGSNGNFAGVPLYLPDGYRLSPSSPGIDQGENMFVGEPLDIDGRPRIVDGNGDGIATVDVGAYEYSEQIFADGFE
ncbi:MAG: NosD domain-containing protein [Lysobacterales bacterium]